MVAGRSVRSPRQCQDNIVTRRTGRLEPTRTSATFPVTRSDKLDAMTDTPWFAPGHMRQRPVRQPQPGESVWTLYRSGRRADCELRYHGESYGWECQLFHDKELVSGRRCVSRPLALQKAEEHRQRLIGAGWRADPDPAPRAAGTA
jgi:hypothetical protein